MWAQTAMDKSDDSLRVDQDISSELLDIGTWPTWEMPPQDQFDIFPNGRRV